MIVEKQTTKNNKKKVKMNINDRETKNLSKKLILNSLAEVLKRIPKELKQEMPHIFTKKLKKRVF